MSSGSDEGISDGQPEVHPDMIGPDGNWVSKRARQNQAGFNPVASLVDPQKFDGLTASALASPSGTKTI